MKPLSGLRVEPGEQSQPMTYSFDRFVLQEPKRQLLQDGACLPTEPKVFDVLLFLIKNRERVVSRQELLENCWPGIYVSDGTLSRCLSRIRQVVGQSRAANEPIQTYHGRGYRFVCDVQVEEAESTTAIRSAAAEVEAKEVATTTSSVAERRFISTIDCRLSHDRLDSDPEALYETLRDFLAASDHVLAGLPCSTAQHPQAYGRLLIHVGYPRAAENPAAVAVSLGQELIDLAKELDLNATITITSGWAIVGPGSGQPGHLLIGIHPELNACLEDVAPDGSLIADAATVELLDGQATVAQVATVTVDGKSQKLYALGRPKVLNLSSSASGEPPFVGRDWELVHLKERWHRAAEGSGQIVLLSGEPGIGKSRLVQELLSQIALPDDRVLPVCCSRYHQRRPIYPLLNLLRHQLEIDFGAPPSMPLKAIEDSSDGTDPPATDIASLVASLLSIPDHKLPTLRQVPEAQREQILEALLFLIGSSTVSGPAVLWVDNLQWADSSTLAMLELLAPRIAELPLMLILSFRSDHQAQLPGLERVTRITLGPLDRSKCLQSLSKQSDAGLLPQSLIGDVAARSDGVPLYLREIVRQATYRSESDRAPADGAVVPARLQGLLASRLDECGEAKQIAQWAAVIGRSFSRDMLARVTEYPHHDLDRCLAVLVEAGILREGGRGEDFEYNFNHVLIRDAAHESLLLRTRRKYHRRVADVILEQFPHLAAADPERVAAHFAASDDPSLAAEYRRAAHNARTKRRATSNARSPRSRVLDMARSATATPAEHALIPRTQGMLARQ